MSATSTNTLSRKQIILSLGSLAIVLGGLAVIAWIIFQGFALLSVKLTQANFSTVAPLIATVLTVMVSYMW